MSSFKGTNKNLFRIIPNKCSKDWVTTSHNSITTRHQDPIDTGFLQWLEDKSHTCMEQIGKRLTLCWLVWDVIKLSSRKIGEKDLSLSRWLVSNVFRKISDCHINWIGWLSTKQGKLSFVGRDDYGNYSAALFSCLGLELLLMSWLKKLMCLRMLCVTYLRTPPPLSCIHIKINPNCLVSISIMMLWLHNEVRCKINVSPQCFDALHDIP
jgi:hypothetical protein